MVLWHQAQYVSVILIFLHRYIFISYILFLVFTFYEFVNLFKMFSKCCHTSYVVSKREDRADVIYGSSLSFVGWR